MADHYSPLFCIDAFLRALRCSKSTKHAQGELPVTANDDRRSSEAPSEIECPRPDRCPQQRIRWKDTESILTRHLYTSSKFVHTEVDRTANRPLTPSLKIAPPHGMQARGGKRI
jgi:hypothetical protein